MFDIVVIGGGASGMAAAIEALNEGAAYVLPKKWIVWAKNYWPQETGAVICLTGTWGAATFMAVWRRCFLK